MICYGFGRGVYLWKLGEIVGVYLLELFFIEEVNC